jgi:valyl-tRNA synthetase
VWQDLEAYRFDETANHLYQFVWHEFCDWYIELAKPRLAPDATPEAAAATRATMVATLETTLRLLHPFMPFITEEIWQKVSHVGDTIVLAPYPKTQPVAPEDEAFEIMMDDIITVITAIRATRSDLNVPPSLKLSAGLRTSAATADSLLRHGQEDIERLARLSQFLAGPDLVVPEGSIVSSTAIGDVFVEIRGVDRSKEQIRLRNELHAQQAEFLRIDTKLKNPQFTTKAPADVVADHERRRSELIKQTSLLSTQLERFAELKDP